MPEALVTIQIKKIKELPADIASMKNVYALVQVGRHRFGRSRKIVGTAEFDLSGEPQPWKLDVPITGQLLIPIRLEIWDDRGDHPAHHVTAAVGALISPWTSGTFEFGLGPKIEVEVLVQRAAAVGTAIRVRRSPTPTTPSATIRLPSPIVLTITEILGLYKPGHNPGPIPGRSPRLAEYMPGYISEDNKGRIYISRDLTGAWKNKSQQVQLTVKVDPHGVPLPKGMKVKWQVVDVDDPTNDDPDFHSQWGPYVDANDYDAAGKHVGAKGDDNHIQFDLSGSAAVTKPYDENPPWKQVGAFALSGASFTEAKTIVNATTHESKVIFRCPNFGGANLIIRAELDAPPPKRPVLPARTGIMTMWKRIDVEVVRMDGAWSLAPHLQSIPPLYENACVQLDFQPERTLPFGVDSPDHIAPDQSTSSPRSAQWVERVFQHRGQGGWFFLGSAKRAQPPVSSAGPSAPVFDSNLKGASFTFAGKDENGHDAWEMVDIVPALPVGTKVEAVVFKWEVNNTPVSMFFPVFDSKPTPAGATRLFYLGHDIQPLFTGNDSDGSLSHAHKVELFFLPKNTFSTQSKTWIGTGYSIPATAHLLALPEEPGETAGRSPPIETSGVKYFAGRTIVFSHHPAYADHSVSPPTEKSEFAADVPVTTAHEFAHAFGMPHKCGYWDDLTPRHHPLREKSSCCMNYWNHWLLRVGTTDTLQPLTDGKNGPRLCGRHLMEIRRVHMEANGGLKWK